MEIAKEIHKFEQNQAHEFVYEKESKEIHPLTVLVIGPVNFSFNMVQPTPKMIEKWEKWNPYIQSQIIRRIHWAKQFLNCTNQNECEKWDNDYFFERFAVLLKNGIPWKLGSGVYGTIYRGIIKNPNLNAVPLVFKIQSFVQDSNRSENLREIGHELKCNDYANRLLLDRKTLHLTFTLQTCKILTQNSCEKMKNQVSVVSVCTVHECADGDLTSLFPTIKCPKTIFHFFIQILSTLVVMAQEYEWNHNDLCFRNILYNHMHKPPAYTCKMKNSSSENFCISTFSSPYLLKLCDFGISKAKNVKGAFFKKRVKFQSVEDLKTTHIHCIDGLNDYARDLLLLVYQFTGDLAASDNLDSIYFYFSKVLDFLIAKCLSDSNFLSTPEQFVDCVFEILSDKFLKPKWKKAFEFEMYSVK